MSGFTLCVEAADKKMHLRQHICPRRGVVLEIFLDYSICSPLHLARFQKDNSLALNVQNELDQYPCAKAKEIENKLDKDGCMCLHCGPLFKSITPPAMVAPAHFPLLKKMAVSIMTETLASKSYAPQQRSKNSSYGIYVSPQRTSLAKSGSLHTCLRRALAPDFKKNISPTACPENPQLCFKRPSRKD
jgi:hypothetical protein